ncbi:BMP family lipoprotein [Nocardioides ultimimeridianus]
MHKSARLAAVAAVAGLALTACGSNNGTATDGTSGATSTATGGSTDASQAAQYPDFKACMVSDTGGFNDHSFNETALKGLTAAGSTYGVKTTKLQSNADSDYAVNLKTEVKAGCDQITAVGFLMADATLAAAKANPKTDFAIIDNSYVDANGKPIKLPANLKELTFATDQPSFLAGYLAAGTSHTGVVGTLGGLQIPTVTIFMDGFLAGVNQYNKDTGKSVKVVGWNGKSGQFSNDFADTSKCKTIATTEIQQGADIVFPVAGGCGTGALDAAKAANDLGIWVDTDGYESLDPTYHSMLLTSVVKRVDNATTAAVLDAASGKWNNDPYVGTLENQGVSLASFHDLDANVPADLKAKIADYQQKIIDGSYTVGSGS